MIISKDRKHEIEACAEQMIKHLIKQTERSFSIHFKKSGRSGNNGQKFNIQARSILEHRKDNDFLKETECFENDREKRIVTDYFAKAAKERQQRASMINHKTQR